jgi:hypothetical protein
MKRGVAHVQPCTPDRPWGFVTSIRAGATTIVEGPSCSLSLVSGDHQHQASKFWFDVSDENMHAEISDIGAPSLVKLSSRLVHTVALLACVVAPFVNISCDDNWAAQLSPQENDHPGKKTARQVTGNVRSSFVPSPWPTQVCCSLRCASNSNFTIADRCFNEMTGLGIRLPYSRADR